MAPEITVGHLCAYVRQKLSCKKKVDIIYCTAGGEDVILGESLTLSLICGGNGQWTVKLSYRPRA